VGKFKSGMALLVAFVFFILAGAGCSSSKPQQTQVPQPAYPAPGSNNGPPGFGPGGRGLTPGRGPGAGTAQSADVQELTTDELTKMMATGKNLVIIDVGTTGEYKEGHIKGSIWGDLQLLRTKPEEYLNSLGVQKTDTIVLVCETGNKSYNTVPYLINAGYRNVYNLAGGKLDWLRAGQKLIKE
jgi:rhodanese-related sulfurtransferase